MKENNGFVRPKILEFSKKVKFWLQQTSRELIMKDLNKDNPQNWLNIIYAQKDQNVCTENQHQIIAKGIIIQKGLNEKRSTFSQWNNS